MNRRSPSPPGPLAHVLFTLTALLSLSACAPAEKPRALSAAGPDSGAAATEAATAQKEKGAEAKEPERPFAKTGAEATSLIDDAIEKKRDGMSECVKAARSRRGDPHAKIEFDIGIDQEGTLIGVKLPKAQKDDSTLLDCVRGALKGALFPRSTAGVITMRKTYVDQVVYPK